VDLDQQNFLSADTIRSGQQAALANDLIALMDALSVQKAIVGGFDWGRACLLHCCCTFFPNVLLGWYQWRDI